MHPTLSVIIPAFNEKGTIQQILEAVQAVPVKKEAVIVQDADLEYDPLRKGILI